jgi:polar amino acid transport system substrate-binding protein
MMLRLVSVFWLIVALLLPLQASAQDVQNLEAQTQAGTSKSKTVAIRLISPFVIEQNGTYSGFSIDLWRAIERELGWNSTFVRKENVGALLEAVVNREADLGIAAISITSKREEIIDFSQPMMDSGLQIMVRASASGGTPIRNMLNFLSSEGFFELLLVLAVLIFVPLPIIWLVERPKGSQMIEAKTKVGAFFKSLWWTTTTLIGQGTDTPMSIGGKLIAVTWMFVGLVFVSYFTGNITAALTVQKLESGISGPSDLYGRAVVTVKGTTSAQFLDQLGIANRQEADVQAAFAAIATGKADAMIYDAPILQHYAATTGRGVVEMAGPIFRPESYGIAFPLQSPLREDVNRVLLQLRENGVYRELYDKWFRIGSDPA